VKAWKVILATLVIFIAGAVAGMGVGRRMHQPKPPPSQQTGGTPIANRVIPNLLAQRANLLRNVERQLDLSSEQRIRIEQIMRDSQIRMKPILEKIDPEMRDEFRFTTLAIREVLTPDQRKQFDDLMKTRFKDRPLEPGRRRPLPPAAIGSPTNAANP
jgi:hypothetical protein